MNIIEAMKTGKRFRRKDWREDLLMYIDNDRFMRTDMTDTENYRGYALLDAYEVLASDWEVEEEKREKTWITYQDAQDAVTTAMHTSGNDNDRFILAMQRLGFDPLEKKNEITKTTITIDYDDLIHALNVPEMSGNTTDRYIQAVWCRLNMERGEE